MSKNYYYHVVYGEGFVDYFGSNVSTEYFWNFTPKKLLNEKGTQVVSFKLNDLPLTKKFIKAYKNKAWATTYDYKIRGNERAFEMLDAPILRVTSKDTYVAYCPDLEEDILPQVNNIWQKLEELLNY